MNLTATNKSDKEWEVVLLSTINTILDEYLINRYWCLSLVAKLFDDLLKSCEHTKMLTQEMFVILKIIAYVAAYFDVEELFLTKKLLSFIFQSLLKISFENSQVS